MFSFGKNKTEARITGEFYVNAIHVMEGATALDDLPAQTAIAPERVTDNYVALPPREAFNIEYWLLEEAKLKRMPPEKELSREVALVVGASPGIGMTVAARLAQEGAHVIVADIREEAAEEVAEEVRRAFGREIAKGVQVDCTDRGSTHRMLRRAPVKMGASTCWFRPRPSFFHPTRRPGGSRTSSGSGLST
jgi:Uncharacterized conserved protein